ncbi:MAG: serine/threonine-protein phosphatase [Opitutales bacterium]|nr:serine/threonine-protein phosphatase [Opitutales bacterium]
MPAPSISWSAQTDVGRFRKNNEDAFIAIRINAEGAERLGKEGHSHVGEHDFIFAVSDGMGGACSGEFASRITVDRIIKLLPSSFKLAASGLNTGFSDVLATLCDGIHQDIVDLGKSYEECEGMGAALSLSWLTPEWLYFAHIGDSRIYHIPSDGSIQQITQDHTHAGWLYREGKLNEREARSHPRRSMLQQALGGKNQFLDPHIGAVKHEPGDAFLICSDGLVDGLWNRRMEEQVRKFRGETEPSRAQILVEEAVRTNGRDNTTALLIYVD